jgi:hypothetical protein
VRVAGGAAALLLSFLASCSDSGASDVPEPAPRPLVEELRIGAVDGGPAAFGTIMALEVDADGNVYVADGLAKEIRVFSADGAHLRSFGREGGGPGEFRMISGMVWGPDGRLRVMDPIAGRLSTMDAEGGHHGAQAREFSFAVSIPWSGGVDREGRVYDMTSTRTDAGETRRVFVRYRPEGERLVGIDTILLDASRAETVEVRRTPGLTERVSIPFSPVERWRLAPDGSVWVGSTGTYRLARVDFAGDTLARLRHGRAPLPVTPAERDSAAAAEGVPADRVPAVKPAFHSFLVDDEGRVWVAPYAAPGSSGTTWDVFSPSGAHLATLATPLSLDTEHPVPVVRASVLYAVVRDDMDVPYVVRLRVPPLP